MSTTPDPYLWISVERYAAELNVRPSELMSRVLDGTLEGLRQEDRWYVARPRVTLFYPDPDDNTVAELQFRALRLGGYLTAGRSEVVIPLRADDPDKDATLSKLMDAGIKPPAEPLQFRLAGQEWTTDSSLYQDLGAAILEFDVEHDLGDLLQQVPPSESE